MPKRSASPSVARPTAVFREHRVAQRTKIFLGHIRPRAVKQDVAIRAHRLHADAVRGQRVVQISGAATVKRIGDDAQLRSAHGLKLINWPSRSR